MGQLIALEERVVSALAWFWGVNAYDQPGVQDAKLAAGAVNKVSLLIESKLCKCSGTVAELRSQMGLDCDLFILQAVLNDICCNSAGYALKV